MFLNMRMSFKITIIKKGVFDLMKFLKFKANLITSRLTQKN